MKKIHKTAAALFLTAALLLSGCMEQSNTTAPGDDTGTSSEISNSNSFNGLESSTDNSTPDISDSSSDQESNTESESNSNSIPDESSDIIIDPNAVPVEFTDEDRELQKILEELESGRSTISVWLTYGSTPSTPKHVFVINGNTRSYYPIPDNYLLGGTVVIPNTYEGMREFVLEYFSERYADNFMYYTVVKGSMTENTDGTFEITFDEKDYDGSLKFIAIDGKIYRDGGSAGGKGLSGMSVDCSTAKIISKTDDTIEFSYLSGFWTQIGEVNQAYLRDESLYEENSLTGILKYERGGWRRDFDKN